MKTRVTVSMKNLKAKADAYKGVGVYGKRRVDAANRAWEEAIKESLPDFAEAIPQYTGNALFSLTKLFHNYGLNVNEFAHPTHNERLRSLRRGQMWNDNMTRLPIMKKNSKGIYSSMTFNITLEYFRMLDQYPAESMGFKRTIHATPWLATNKFGDSLRRKLHAKLVKYYLGEIKNIRNIKVK